MLNSLINTKYEFMNSLFCLRLIERRSLTKVIVLLKIHIVTNQASSVNVLRVNKAL